MKTRKQVWIWRGGLLLLAVGLLLLGLLLWQPQPTPTLTPTPEPPVPAVLPSVTAPLTENALVPLQPSPLHPLQLTNQALAAQEAARSAAVEAALTATAAVSGGEQ